MTRQAKFFLFVVVAVGLFFGVKFGISHGWIPAVGVLKAIVPDKVKLPELSDAVIGDVQPAAFPSNKANNCNDPIRAEIWAWNSQIGWLYSNGGVDTTKGSLGDKHGVCLHFTRQDDTTQMQNDLLACSKELGSGTECSNGTHFVVIMADGAGQFLATLNSAAKKNCSDCTAEIVGTTGFSRGEDALWGPEEWKRNPKSMLGDGLIVGVLRDGDWDTALKYEGDNGLKNNPDEHTFDASAVNWVNAASYTKAAEIFVAGYCEDRKVIKDGKLTGETKNVCVKGLVTWTPGDVTASKNKGGIVPVVSTKQYRTQMPSAIIGIKKWNKSHADRVAGMLAAALEGGDQVRAFPKALDIGGDISAKVYGEERGSYWVKYYKGATERDKTGMTVDLGGSYADNMNDALAVFGLAPGTKNSVKATYTVFAKIVDQQYHELFAKTPIPPYDQVATTSYLLQAKSLLDNQGSAADTPQYSASEDPSQVVGDKNVSIDFATGSDKLTSDGMRAVQQISDETAVAQGLSIILNGHTDNTGNSAANRALSLARAASVKTALKHMAPTDYPDARFRVNGFGDSKPIADNSTADGRAKNRRVEIILAQ